MKTKLFTLFLALVASVGTMHASIYNGTCGPNLTWTFNTEDGSLVIEGSGAMNDYYSYQDAPWFEQIHVDDVHWRRMIECIRTITISEGVTSIGFNAFYIGNGLTSVLTSIEIPNSVTSIGYSAFEGHSVLTSIEIPNSVTRIQGGAFSRCSNLTSISVAVGNTVYDSRDNCNAIIESAENDLIVGCKSTIIPDSVKSIGSSAFSGCTGLTSIEIPNSVTSIGDYAFSGCTGLTSIEIPNSVTSIGGYAFKNCSGVKSFKLSANLVIDEYYQFYVCGHLRSSGTISSGDTSCVWMQRLESLEAPAWFFDVSEANWIYCPKQLEKVVVNNGELSDNGFLVIARSYKTLKSLDLSALTNTELADEALKNFYNMTALKLPKHVERIGYMSVAECVKLQLIDIPASVKEIEDRAFENCRSLKSITFGGKRPAAMPGRNNVLAASNSELQRIGNWAFYNCHELQNLEIPEGVTEIGDGAFYGCTYLENLSLPASVQSIGDNTFALCSKMKKIVVNAPVPPAIQSKTFYDVNRQIPVYVPDNCVTAYKNDAQWGEFNIQGISNMPEGLEEIINDQSSIINKVMIDGQILILRGDKTYTLTGQEVK